MKQRLVCPICGNTFMEATTEAMPFCSQRCRMVDLSRWMNEEYGLPYERLDDDEDEGEVLDWMENSIDE